MLRLLDTRRPRLLLSVFCLLLWLPGFFTLPPGDRDESRFAQATKQMLETGDLVSIRNGAEARNRKPIGIHWLQLPFVVAADAAGVATPTTIWPYRLPSLLGALAAVLGTFALGVGLVGRREALLGAAFLAASVLLTVEAHIAKTDAALLGAVVLAMGGLARAYRAPEMVGPARAALFWLALAGSILLKGPIGPMVVGLTALSLGIADRRWRWLAALRPGWGVPLLVAAVLPWFVAIGVATHGRFFSEAVGGDLGRKLTSGDDAHWGPPGLHLLLLPITLFPAFAALPAGLTQAWRHRRDGAERFLLAWAIPSWAVFEAVPTKLPHYILPLLPALCLLAAGALLRERAAMSRWAAALGGLVALALGAGLAALPVVLGAPVWLGLPAVVAAVGYAVGFATLVRSPDPSRLRHRVLTLVVSAPFLFWSVLGFELPRLRALWIAPRVAAALLPGPAGAVGFAEPSLMFLAGTDLRWLTAIEGATALRSGRVRSLAVGDRDWAAVRAALDAAGAQPSVLAEVSGFNYSRGRKITTKVISLEK